jgi:uncharacterized protein YjbI with pentapeptide repeats
MQRSKWSPSPDLVRINASQFEALVRAHEAFTSGRPGGRRALTRFIVARGVQAHKRQMQDIDFTGADLTGSSFIASDMSRAALYCADLSKADLRATKLIRADLRGARFNGARMAGAVLDGADMRAAILCAVDDLRGLRRMGAGASLAGASLNGVDMDEAIAYQVDFTNCSMRGINLRNCNLKGANFAGANLDGADFAGARIEGANFNDTILTGVNVEALMLPPSVLARCVMSPTASAIARLDQIQIEIDGSHLWGITNGVQGRPARLAGMDLRPASSLFKAKFLGGLTARNTMAIGLDFSEAELQGAIFDGADLRNANFTGADLRGASFVNAKLSHAVFDKAVIGDLELIRGSRRATNFEGAQLEGTHIVLQPKRAEVVA